MTKEHLQQNRDPAHYRPGVGILLFNKEGHVFLAERLNWPGSWQMPQGGIDEDETPEITVFREMEEEIGTRNAEIIDVMEEWLFYDFPEAVAKRLFNNKYKGQRQRWIALRFLGEDAEIDLEFHHEPEFGKWKWVPIYEILDFAVPFKRPMYERIIQEFKKHALDDT